MLREFAGNLTLRSWEYAAFDDLFGITLRMWLPWLVVSPLVVAVVKRVPIMPDKAFKTLFIHLCLVSTLVLLHLAVLAYRYQFFEDNKAPEMLAYAGWEHMGHFIVGDPIVLTDFVIYGLFVATFNFSRYIQIVRDKEQVTTSLESHLIESKLRALQMQVHPHFLFNTLNSITVLIRNHDFDAAEEMIHRLSDFFRTTLEQEVGQTIPLASELELLDNYLAIEEQRFRDRLRVVREIDPRLLSAEVPALILQPIVENCIRHGISKIDGPGEIGIVGHWMADRTLLEIVDNGPGLKSPDGVPFREGIGLANVRARLQQLYPNRHVFTVDERQGGGTRVRIELPSATTDLQAHTEGAGR